MKKTFRTRFGFSCSDNRKPVLSHVKGSKTCTELSRSIENPKWLGVVGILVFTLECVVMARRRSGKVLSQTARKEYAFS